MSDPVIIGQKKTVQQRVDEYNEKRKALDAEYNFVLSADAFIENGLVKARPTLIPIELLPKDPGPVAEEHIHEAKKKGEDSAE